MTDSSALADPFRFEYDPATVRYGPPELEPTREDIVGVLEAAW